MVDKGIFMTHFLDKICSFLENKGYELEDRDLFIHGIKIFINDGLNLFSILIIGLFTNTALTSLIYFFLFGLLRTKTGGFHNTTKLKCFFTYIFLYLLFIFLSHTIFLELNFLNFILTTSSAFIIFFFSPLQHINNPLSLELVRINAKQARQRCLLIYGLYMLLFICDIQFTRTFSIVLIYTSALMLLHMKTKYYMR